MNEYIKLCELPMGEWGRVKRVENEHGIKKRLLDMGLTENSLVRCVGKSPMGDPTAYLVRGAVIAIRNENGADIWVQRC